MSIHEVLQKRLRIQKNGSPGLRREEVDAVDENGSVVEAPVGSKKASIPKDVR